MRVLSVADPAHTHSCFCSSRRKLNRRRRNDSKDRWIVSAARDACKLVLSKVDSSGRE